MTEQTQPTDAEILDTADDFRSQYKHGGTTFDEFDALGFARAVLAKWGTPAGAGEQVAWRMRMICCGKDAGFQLAKTWESADTFRNEYTSGAGVEPHGFSAPEHSGGHRRAVIIEGLYATPQPTQAQAGAVPLTQYRILEPRVDRIEADDEYLQDDAQTWATDPNGTFVGTIYGYALRAARRRIAKKEGAGHG